MIDFNRLELAVLCEMDANPDDEVWWSAEVAKDQLRTILEHVGGDEISCAHAIREQIEDRYGADSIGLIGVRLFLEPDPTCPTTLLDVVEWVVRQVATDIRGFTGHRRIWMKRQLRDFRPPLWPGLPF